MRIIAGAHKRRTLKTPAWDGLRPTSDRLRETLFNILAGRVEDARVLDAFAGTGAVALEALSRGARAAVCLEQDRRAHALIRDNSLRVGEEARCMILRVDARRALEAPLAGGPFEIVFLDPPYDVEDLEGLVRAAATQRADGGVLVLEHATRRPPPRLSGVPPQRSVRAGDSTLSFYL
jgi:16S rRNA (guanine(966)-N(2))-methyltransferase RsmD